MRLLALISLVSWVAFAGGRQLSVTTFDGREISGEVVLEGESGLLLRTATGNVLVPWADIAASRDLSAPRPPPAPVQPQSTPSATGPQLGLSIGVGGMPTGIGAFFSGPKAWLATELSMFLHVDFGRLALRFAVPVQLGGLVGEYRPYFMMFAGLDSQLRLQFSERVASGLGLQLGLGGRANSVYLPGFGAPGEFGAYFAFGPTLTPVSVRLGKDRNHELALEGSLQFTPVPNAVAYAGGLICVKYAFLF